MLSEPLFMFFTEIPELKVPGVQCSQHRALWASSWLTALLPSALAWACWELQAPQELPLPGCRAAAPGAAMTVLCAVLCRHRAQGTGCSFPDPARR